jgi:hypothetical protein
LEYAASILKRSYVVALALAVIAIGCGAIFGSTQQRYVFSLELGLEGAPIGSELAKYQRLLSPTVVLPPGRYPPCTEFWYAVSQAARRSRTADVLLVSCSKNQRVEEVHLSSSAFCTVAGTCIGTPGSLRRIIRELAGPATLTTRGECTHGMGYCSLVQARHGKIRTVISSSNCAHIQSLVVPARCRVSDVVIWTR